MQAQSKMPTRHGGVRFFRGCRRIRTGEAVVASTDAALFPVSANGDRLYYIRLEQTGSWLYSAEIRSGDQQAVVQLSKGLTRDWTWSPTSRRCGRVTTHRWTR